MAQGERYTSHMAKAPQRPVEVGVRELRAHLSALLKQVREGHEFTVTDRGRPVARIVPIAGLSKLEQLIAEGKITLPKGPRHPASDLEVARVSEDLTRFVLWARGTDE